MSRTETLAGLVVVFRAALAMGRQRTFSSPPLAEPSYTSVAVDKVGTTLADGPAVRLALNGNTVYSAFLRWNSEVYRNDDGVRYNSQVVVVRSDNGGMDGFTALGTNGDGKGVGSRNAYRRELQYRQGTQNNPLTHSQERVGSDVAIAIDPNNAKHVLLVSDDAPTRGQLQLVESESTDGGPTWLKKSSTSPTTRSAQPGLAILASGAMGLLYNNYNPRDRRIVAAPADDDR